MQSIILISSLPLLQVCLGIFWLWVCGWLIKDGRKCYGADYWDSSQNWTTCVLLLIWSITCYIGHMAITWWSIVLTKGYVAALASQ